MKALKICDDLDISKKRDGAIGMFGGLVGLGRVTDYQGWLVSEHFCCEALSSLPPPFPILSMARRILTD